VGLASTFDVERARTQAASARAAIPPLETLAATARHRIAVLIGSQAADAATIKPSNVSATIPDIRAGQPAQLLERRPDLLASRAQLQAANFRRRQAAAEWFPRLLVGALFGRQSVDVNDVDLGSTRFSNVSSLLTMPIFDWGRTRSINEIAGSAQKEALLRYEDAIVRALEDVENALVALRDQRLRTEALQTAAASADAALGRAQSLYDRGQIDLLPLLDAQRTRLNVRVSTNESNTRLLLATVNLFKALGGGWQAFEPDAAASSTEAIHPTQSGTLASTIEDQP
jgi:outer membrane protein TolC